MCCKGKLSFWWNIQFWAEWNIAACAACGQNLGKFGCAFSTSFLTISIVKHIGLTLILLKTALFALFMHKKPITVIFQSVLNVSPSVLSCSLTTAQRSSRSLHRRDGSCTGSSLWGDDVHELHLRFQPHPSQTPLSRLWQGEYPVPQEVQRLTPGMPPTVGAVLLCCCRLFAGAAAGTDIRWSTWKTAWPKCVITATASWRREVRIQMKKKGNMMITLKSYFSEAMHF